MVQGACHSSWNLVAHELHYLSSRRSPAPVHVGGGGVVWKTKLRAGGSAISQLSWASPYTSGACFLFCKMRPRMPKLMRMEGDARQSSSSETSLYKTRSELVFPFLPSA